jgi:hypothetical protein
MILLFFKSGRRDSNSRPPAPKAGALTGLRYAPKTFGIAMKLLPFQKVYSGY